MKNGHTGEKVLESGTYKNKYGKKITLKEGESFPPCPVKSNPIQWEKID